MLRLPRSFGFGFSFDFSPQGGQGSGFSPLDLFANGENGLLYDFSIATQLIQTQSGSAEVSVDSDPVGLALEHHAWEGMTLGDLVASKPELFLSPSFDNAGVWSLGAGFSIVGGQLVGNNVANTGVVNQTTQVAAGLDNQTFRYSALVSAYTVGAIVSRVRGGSTYNLGVTGPGLHKNYPLGAASAPASNTHGVRAAGVATTITIDEISLKHVPGNHARQSTSGSRPQWKQGELLRFDGSDDNLLTTLNPSPAFSLVLKGKMASGSKAFFGSKITAADAVGMATDANGNLAAEVGTDTTATIFGAGDVRGVVGVYALTYSAADGVRLYRSGVQIYSGPLAGTPNTTIPLRIGSQNNNGVAATFGDLDLYHVLAVNRVLTPEEIIKLTNSWGTT